LSPGLNSIVISAKDRAGNQTTITNWYNLDFTIDHQAPAFTLQVPNNGTFIAAQGYGLHGNVDDPSAQIHVHIDTANGGSYDRDEGVQRNGDFSVANLPIDTGANTVTVTAVDAAGNAASGVKLTELNVMLCKDTNKVSFWFAIACCLLIGCGKEEGTSRVRTKQDVFGERQPPTIQSGKTLVPTNLSLEVDSSHKTSEASDVLPATAKIGDKVWTVPSILNAISNDFKGQQFHSTRRSGISDEDLLIERLLFTLGAFAETNDQAYSFLKEGANFSFWRSVVNWNTSRSSDVYGILAGCCVQAIGVSARSNVLSDLKEMRNYNLISTSENKPPRSISGSLADAAFYTLTIQQKGRAYFDELLQSGDSIAELRLWWQTPEGAEWKSWLNKFDREHRSETNPF